MYRQIKGSSRRESIELRLNESNTVVITPTHYGCRIYFYGRGGIPSSWRAKSYYEEYYADGFVDFVDTKAGFVEMNLSFEDVCQDFIDRGYSYNETVMNTTRIRGNRYVKSSRGTQPSSNYRQVFAKYSQEQLQLVRDCFRDVLAEISEHFDNEEYTPQISAVKRDYMAEAAEYDILTDAEFNEIYAALDAESTDLAAAYA